MGVVTIVSEIAEVIVSVSGINAPQATPRENTNEFPFAMVYLMDGATNIGPVGTMKSLDNYAIDVLTPRRDINEDLAILLPLVDSIRTALISEVASGGGVFDTSISTYGNLRVEFMPLYPYAGADMIGYRFVMEDVKLLVNL